MNAIDKAIIVLEHLNTPNRDLMRIADSNDATLAKAARELLARRARAYRREHAALIG